MDVLFLCHRIPYPPDKGDKIRSYHRLVHLARRGNVDLVTHVDDPRDLRHVQILRDMCRSVEVLPLAPLASRLRALRAGVLGGSLTTAWMTRARGHEVVRRLMAQHRYDLFYAYSSQSGVYFPDELPAPFLMEMVDVDSEKFEAYAQEASPPRSWVYGLEARRLRQLERQLASRAQRVLLSTPNEVEVFERRIGKGGAAAISNGVRRPDAVVPAADRDPGLIVFVGQMDYGPNVEAVSVAAREILPRVREEVPDARFRIVGRAPTRAVQALAELPGVEVTGGVADLRPHLEAASLSLVPLRVARGIQNKVLEAMAHGLPVVAPSAVVRCLDPGAGAGIQRAETPSEMAEAVIALLPDIAARAQLGESARAFVETHHDWARLDEAFDHLLEDLLHDTPAGAVE